MSSSVKKRLLRSRVSRGTPTLYVMRVDTITHSKTLLQPGGSSHSSPNCCCSSLCIQICSCERRVVAHLILHSGRISELKCFNFLKPQAPEFSPVSKYRQKQRSRLCFRKLAHLTNQIWIWYKWLLKEKTWFCWENVSQWNHDHFIKLLQRRVAWNHKETETVPSLQAHGHRGAFLRVATDPKQMPEFEQYLITHMQ